MSGSAPSNNQAVDFEKEQAAEADAKEATRQANLTQGKNLIDQIFNGSPVMATTSTPFDWSKFSPTTNTALQQYESIAPAANQPSIYSDPSLPAGYKIQKAPAGAGASVAGTDAGAFAGFPTTSATKSAGGVPNVMSELAGFPTTSATKSAGGAPSITSETAGWPGGTGSSSGSGGGWQIVGPDGKVYNQGDKFDVTTSTDTGKTSGGFDDDFYNAYTKQIEDYYNPDEQRQYNQASSSLLGSLADSGQIHSSVAAQKQGELAYNDALQKANIVANANTQTGQLKSQIQSNKESLINQLYATEDPTLTADLAQSSAAASRLQSPNLTPAAALFTPALSTVGSAVNGLLYPNAASSSFAGGASSGVANANNSAGKVITT